MVDFMRGYAPPMERPFDEPGEPIMPLPKDIEAPIIPISQIGMTVVDHGQGNILTNLNQALAVGTKKVQLVVAGTGLSKLVTAHGKDVRDEIRERAMAAGVEITGVELAPNVINGMGGFQGQGRESPDQARADALSQVKDAIRFAAEIGASGVDIHSAEFPRDIIDADWNKDKQFFTYSEDELKDPSKTPSQKYVINTRTGKVMEPIRRDQIYRDVVRDANGDPIWDDEKQEYKIEELSWDDIKERAKKAGKAPEEYFYHNQIDTQKAKTHGEMEHYRARAEEMEAQREQALDQKKKLESNTKEKIAENVRQQYEQEIAPRRMQIEMKRDQLIKGGAKAIEQQLKHEKGGDLNEAELDDIKKKAKEKYDRDLDSMNQNLSELQVDTAEIERQASATFDQVQDQLRNAERSVDLYQRQKRSFQEQATVLAQQMREYEEMKRDIQSLDTYAKDKVWENYAEAALYAYKVSQEKKLKKPIHIGPEIGRADGPWAGNYGSHPDEFVELMAKSRERLAKKLQDKEGLNEAAAKKHARQHIKGVLDTTHLSAWYKHFARNPKENEQAHLKRFNEWMKEKVVKMVKEDMIGDVQLVDSPTGEHSHLPVGQGIFDMKGLAEAMKKAGFEGGFISEGHEMDTSNYGKGLIFTKTAEALGTPINSYTPGVPSRTWGNVNQSYFGHTTPTNYIVGGYSPSNEWQLWSETPLE